MKRFQVLTFTAVLLLTIVAWRAACGAEPAGELVTVQGGDLPIILSAPHGGGRGIPGVPRRQGEGLKRFVTRSDTRTAVLTEKIAAAIEKQTGKRPYVVIARFHRQYLDANRRVGLAFEAEKAKPVYEAYHAAIRRARSDVAARWGFGLLLDVHGQNAKPGSIIRGTQNGKTTTHLIARFGRGALTGASSLFGQLAAQGFAVLPPVDSKTLEPDAFDGGYIVRTHGSAEGGTIDAIQLETGFNLRKPSVIDATATRMAAAIVAYSKKHLPTKEQKPAAAQR